MYEWQCRECSYRFEKIQQFSDPPLTKCPKCGKEALEQLLSAPAVQFKGSGWYVTDYAKKNSAGSSSLKSDASEKSDKKVEGSADSKSEKASETKSEPKPKSDKKK